MNALAMVVAMKRVLIRYLVGPKKQLLEHE